MALPRTSDVAATARRAAGYGGSVGTLLVRLVRSPEFPMPEQVTPVRQSDVAAQFADTPQEVTLQAMNEGVMAFALQDPEAGEGLRYAHRPSENAARDARRFWSSKGIDVAPMIPGESVSGQTIRLSKAVELVRAFDFNDHDYVVTFAGGRIWAIDRDSDFGDAKSLMVFTAASNDWSSITEQLAETFTDSQMYLGSIEDMLLSFVGSSWPAPASGTVGGYGDATSGASIFITETQHLSLYLGDSGRVVDGLAGRMLVQGRTGITGFSVQSSGVFEIGTQDDYTTDLEATEVFPLDGKTAMTCGADAGNVILVGATDGVLRMLAPDSTGALGLVGQVEFPSGQYPTAVSANAGRVMIGTAQVDVSGEVTCRIWTGEITTDRDGSWTVADLRLRHVFDKAGVGDGPTGAIAKDASVYMGIPGGTNRDTTIWRYNVATDGLTEDADLGVTNRILKMGVLNGVLLFAVEGSGVWRQVPDEYVDTGWIISPAADFFDHRSKQWHLARVDASNLASGGSQVVMKVSTDPEAVLDPDDSSWTTYITADAAADAGVDTPIAPASVQEGRYVAVKLELTASSDNTVTPLCAATVVGDVTTDDVSIVLPVNVSDRIEMPGRRPFTARGHGQAVLEELRSMVGDIVDVEVYAPALTMRGRVTGVQHRSVDQSGTLVANVAIQGQLT